MTPSPYAPPRAPIAPYGTVDVRTNEPLPAVCLKCGTAHDVTPHAKRLMVVARARIATLAFAIAGGVVVAVVRSPQVRILFFAGATVVAFVVRRFLQPRLDLPIALCGACAQRWATGARWSQVLRVAIFVSSVAAMFLMFVEGSPLLVILFGFALFGSIVGLLALRMRSRIVVVSQLKDDVATLVLVHSDAVAAIKSARA